MHNVPLSKSLYCSCIRCEKIAWLKKYKGEYDSGHSDNIFLENGRRVGLLARSLFGKCVEVSFNDNLEVMLSDTCKLLDKKPNVIAEASFVHDANFCSVDLLKNDIDGVEIYEVKSSTRLKDSYIDDVAYQYHVLSSCGLNVKRACVITINNKYVRVGKLELDKLFSITDITEDVHKKQEDVARNIDLINRINFEYDQTAEPVVSIGEHCLKGHKCDFWDWCTRNLPKPNVFDLSQMHVKKKLELYNEKKLSYTDLQHEDLSPKILQQIDFELNDRAPYIDKEYISELVQSLEYPLYFVDYESYQPAVPELENTRPYQQLPFQYSLHIKEDENSPLLHREFLAECDDGDFIRHFGLSLIDDIRDEGSVIAYNKSFEAGINKMIAKMYPEFKDDMTRLNGNMIDFLKPFQQRKYYSRDMHGLSSIKVVLPALYPDDEELDYDSLSVVHKGSEASEAFLQLKNMTIDEQKRVRQGLLEYCRLDTLAMVKIYEKFIEVSR